jgi:hypothetical protein
MKVLKYCLVLQIFVILSILLYHVNISNLIVHIQNPFLPGLLETFSINDLLFAVNRADLYGYYTVTKKNDPSRNKISELALRIENVDAVRFQVEGTFPSVDRPVSIFNEIKRGNKFENSLVFNLAMINYQGKELVLQSAILNLIKRTFSYLPKQIDVEIKIHFLEPVDFLPINKKASSFYKSQIFSPSYGDLISHTVEPRRKQIYLFVQESNNSFHEEESDFLFLSLTQDEKRDNPTEWNRMISLVDSFILKTLFPINFHLITENILSKNYDNSQTKVFLDRAQSPEYLDYLSIINENYLLVNSVRILSTKWEKFVDAIKLIQQTQKIPYFVEIALVLFDLEYLELKHQFLLEWIAVHSSIEKKTNVSVEQIERIAGLLEEMNAKLLGWKTFEILTFLNIPYLQQFMIMYGTFFFPVMVPLSRILKILFFLPKKSNP